MSRRPLALNLGKELQRALQEVPGRRDPLTPEPPAPRGPHVCEFPVEQRFNGGLVVFSCTCGRWVGDAIMLLQQRVKELEDAQG